ncbi:MAG: hypothetical protein WCH98_15440 [Verrucomicrobiota bacterium]
MKRFTALSIAVVLGLIGCATSQTKLEWSKPGATEEQKVRDLAAAKSEAFKVYPDPISSAQIQAENIDAPLVRTTKRNEIIKLEMAARGWKIIEVPR